MSVRSAKSGEVLYEHNENLRLRPASNMKLLTAAAAFKTLGSDFTFQTQLLTDGRISWRGLRGNVYLKGMGDPTLTKSGIEQMVKSLKEEGIRYINGDLVADDTWYDHVRYSIDLPWSDEEAYYGAQVSALTISPKENYDPGTLIIEIKAPKDINNNAIINIKPNTNYVKIINHIQVVEEPEKMELSLKREHGTNTVIIEGTLPINSDEISEVIAIWEPTGLALDLLQNSLKKHGIKHRGKIKIGPTPSEAFILSEIKSKPLSDIMIPFMKFSLNTYGEVLIKEMGKQIKDAGSWDCGLYVMEAALQKIGINTDSFIMRDGSGISHVNALTTNELTKLLYKVQNESWFNAYFKSLPVAGKKGVIGGTLQNRLNHTVSEGKVFAKTGTLSTVSAISGYIETINGETLIFSIIFNHLLDDKKGKEIEDQIMLDLFEM